MATVYKVLGQSAPSAATATTLYTVPSATSTVVSTINVVNTNASTADTIRIAVRPAGAALALHHARQLQRQPRPVPQPVGRTWPATAAALATFGFDKRAKARSPATAARDPPPVAPV